jgi:CHASE2 domain
MSNELDLLGQILSEKLPPEQVESLMSKLTIALGARSVAIAGNSDGSVTITGDRNIAGNNNRVVINQGIDGEELVRLLQNLLPTQKKKVLILGARWRTFIILVATVASLLPQVKAFTIDIEQSLVSVVRGLSSPSLDKTEPNILLVHIDKESLERDRISQKSPIDRNYLAQIIKQLTTEKVKYIAVSYILDQSTGNPDKNLGKIIRDAVNNQQVKFAFGSEIKEDKELGIDSNIDIGLMNQTISGNLHPECYGNSAHCIEYWNPKADDPVSFSYLLAMMQERSHTQSPTRWDKDTIKNSQITSVVNPVPWLTSLKIDYSRLPDTIYERISAEKLLQNSISFDRSNKVVLIAAGGYAEAGDNYPIPLAVRLHSVASRTKNRPEYFINNRLFTNGEIHAYIANQILKKSLIVRIEDFVIMIVIIIFSIVGWAKFKFYNQKNSHQDLILSISFIAYIPFCLIFYLASNIAIPFTLPMATIFLTYILPIYWNRRCLNSEN